MPSLGRMTADDDGPGKIARSRVYTARPLLPEVTLGLFDRLFNKPAARLDKARKLMADGRYAEARTAVVDVDLPEAKALVAEAEAKLVELNLERAVQRARAGDLDAAQAHLDTATAFRTPGQDALFDEAEGRIRALQVESARDEIWDDLTAAAARRRKLGDDPGDFARQALGGAGAVRLYFGGNEPFGLPGIEIEPRAEEFVPPWVPETADPPTAAEAKAVADALRAAWPEALHPHVEAGGDGLIRAMVALAHRRPEKAVELLLDSPEDNPVCRFELGRAAAALGCHPAAVMALRQTREAVEAPFAVGGLPLRVFGARCLRWAGARGAAWQTMSDLDDADRAYDPHLFVAAAIEANQLDAADAVLETLPDEDEAGPQLDAALVLRRALVAEVEAAPILADASKQGSPAFRRAAEATAARLQAEVDGVLAALRDLESEEG